MRAARKWKLNGWRTCGTRRNATSQPLTGGVLVPNRDTVVEYYTYSRSRKTAVSKALLTPTNWWCNVVLVVVVVVVLCQEAQLQAALSHTSTVQQPFKAQQASRILSNRRHL